MVTARPALLESLASWPDSPTAQRPAAGWNEDPLLDQFPTPAVATRAAAGDPAVFDLLARRVDDATATTACLAAVAGRLLPIARRWARCGLRGEDLADAEAALVTEALAILRAHPDLGAERVAQRAWHRAHNQRRTARARAARHLPLTDHILQHPAVVSDDPLRAALTLVSGWLANRTLTVSAAGCLWAAMCGWPAIHAARLAGCEPGAWRSRHSRARRTARTALANDGGW
jgi:hypothetical protein